MIDGEINAELMRLESSEDIIKAVIFNSTAFINKGDDGTEKTTGNVTEVGLINYM